MVVGVVVLEEVEQEEQEQLDASLAEGRARRSLLPSKLLLLLPRLLPRLLPLPQLQVEQEEQQQEAPPEQRASSAPPGSRAPSSGGRSRGSLTLPTRASPSTATASGFPMGTW